MKLPRVFDVDFSRPSMCFETSLHHITIETDDAGLPFIQRMLGGLESERNKQYQIVQLERQRNELDAKIAKLKEAGE